MDACSGGEAPEVVPAFGSEDIAIVEGYAGRDFFREGHSKSKFGGEDPVAFQSETAGPELKSTRFHLYDSFQGGDSQLLYDKRTGMSGSEGVVFCVSRQGGVLRVAFGGGADRADLPEGHASRPGEEGLSREIVEKGQKKDRDDDSRSDDCPHDACVYHIYFVLHSVAV